MGIPSSSSKSADRLTISLNCKTEKADIKVQAIRGGALSFIGQVAKFVIRTGSTIILARLLVPEDFGLIAMVGAVINFAALFKDLGLSMATVQKENINHAQVSNLFWINVVVSSLAAVIVSLLSPLIVWFYGEPRLGLITFVTSMTIVLGGLSVQHQALLRRDMRFRSLAVIDVISLLVSFILALVLALLGARHWALVVQQVSFSLMYVILIWCVCRWRPGKPRRQSGVRAMLGFGRDITAVSLLGYFTRNLDKILVGRQAGSFVLGLYSKAQGLLMIPMQQIRVPLVSVAVPALSRLQNDSKAYRKYYERLLLLLSFTTMPLTIYLAVCSESLFRLCLGTQWLDATKFFKVMAFSAFIRPVFSTLAVVLLSLGLSKRYLVFGVINGLLIPLSYVIGIRWGAIGVATGYAIANYSLFIPLFWYCFRGTPISLPGSLRRISRAALSSLGMLLAILLLQKSCSNMLDSVNVVASLIAGLLSYFLIWLALPGGKTLLCEFWGYLKVLLPSKDEN